jgi:hypothetical protein
MMPVMAASATFVNAARCFTVAGTLAVERDGPASARPRSMPTIEVHALPRSCATPVTWLGHGVTGASLRYPCNRGIDKGVDAIPELDMGVEWLRAYGGCNGIDRCIRRIVKP